MKKYLILILLFAIVGNMYSQNHFVYKSELTRGADVTNWSDSNTIISFMGKTVTFREPNDALKIKTFIITETELVEKENAVAFSLEDEDGDTWGLSVMYLKKDNLYCISIYYNDDTWFDYIARRIK